MRIVLILLILLVGIDFVFNDALILNKLNSFEYPIPLLIKLLFVVICLLSVFLLVHAILMEWHLWPKLKVKKTIFDIEKENHKDKHSLIK